MEIGVVGAAGRMGRMIIRQIEAHEDCRLVGATVHADSEWRGRDVGEITGGRNTGVIAETDPFIAFQKARAIIDFSTPEVTLATAEVAAQARAVHVIGTTGMDDAQLAQLTPAARHAVIVRAGNMSVGVNLLTALTRQVARALGADYDIEIVEAHHKHKVDAPSGTALMLGEAAAAGRDVDLATHKVSGRDGLTGARAAGTIGFSAIRGGDIIGEHDVIFAGAGERISLRHVASDRALFANGAIRAALWGRDKKPGEYSMLDVLGIE